MYNAETLLDIHARAHESFRRLIVFCGNLTEDELRRPLTGFGFPTVRRQLEHTIGAEVYWQTVVTRGYTEEATMPNVADVAAIDDDDLAAERTQRGDEAAVICIAPGRRVERAGHGKAERYHSAPSYQAREMITDPGRTRVLRPADVIMRVVTHIFNHQGQVLAMCRVIGKPNDTRDLDYPVVTDRTSFERSPAP